MTKYGRKSAFNSVEKQTINKVEINNDKNTSSIKHIHQKHLNSTGDRRAPLWLAGSAEFKAETPPVDRWGSAPSTATSFDSKR